MMTSQGHPGDRTPESRDLALALLTARLSELSQRVGELASRVEAAEIAIGGQISTLADTANLAREVSQLSASIAMQNTAGRARADSAHPRQPVWAAMKDTEYLDALRDVTSWVTGVLFYRYPGTGTVLPPCWPAHPAVVEELDWLYWDWTSWALDPDARSRDAADWHDRWLPGVLARIRPQLAICAQKGRHARPASRRQVPADLDIPGRSPDAVFIDQMERARQSER
jgi:hypothetical protein